MLMDIKNDLLRVLEGYYQSGIEWFPKLVLGLLILVIFWWLAVRLRRFTVRKLTLRMEDPLLAKFMARILKWIILIIGLIISLKTMDMGDIAGGLLAGASVSAFIIGFAFKDIGENFLAGILLAFSRPFQVGHTIETGDIKGNVVALDLRITQVKTFDGKDVFIPNSNLIKNPLINYTIDGFLRQDFIVGIDYDTDVDAAINIMLSTVSGIEGILKDKAPSVAVSNLGASSLGLQVFYWLDTFDKNVSGVKIKTEAIRTTLEALTEAGIYLPGDILELKNYKNTNLEYSGAGN